MKTKLNYVVYLDSGMFGLEYRKEVSRFTLTEDEKEHTENYGDYHVTTNLVTKVKRETTLFASGPLYRSTMENLKAMTDTAGYYINVKSHQYVSIDLWNVYGKHCNPYIGRLWIDSITRVNELTGYDYENQLQEKYQAFLSLVYELFFHQGKKNQEILDCLADEYGITTTISEINQLKKDAFQFVRSGELQTMRSEKHTYIMVRTTSNNMKRVEIIPKHENVLMRWYREYLATVQIVDDSTMVSDLIQESSVAIMELVNVGLIRDYTDISRFSGYVYTRINRYIRKLSYTGKHETILNDGVNFSGKFTAPDSYVTRLFVSQFEDYVLQNMKIRRGKETAYRYVLKHVIEYREKQTDVAKKLDISEGMVRKCRDRLLDFLRSEDCRKFLDNAFDVIGKSCVKREYLVKFDELRSWAVNS